MGNTSGYPTSVSDSAGSLLFYSDGVKVYNANHLVMPNGFGLYAVGGTQIVFSVKKPGDDSLYYLFYINDLLPYLFHGLYYSLIDMHLDGGLGDIVAGQKNIPVSGMSDAMDLLTATRHQNNKDVWLVTKKYLTNQYASILISASGISPTITLSQSQAPVTNVSPGSGELWISPDGTKLISKYYPLNDYAAEFCSFNKEIGIVTPLFNLKLIVGSNQCFISTCGFSPNSKLLYINGGLPLPSTIGGIFQFDISTTDSALILASKIQVYQKNISTAFGIDPPFRIGPDWKLYFPTWNHDSVHVINNPNIQGIGCNVQINSVSLSGRVNSVGLPQMLQKYKAYLHYSGSGCQIDSVHFSGDIWPPADTIRWNFGDPVSGGSNVSYLATPAHLFSGPGTYTVELYVRHNDNRTDTTWRSITIYPSPGPSLGPDKTICSGNSATFDAGFCTGCSYEWKNLGSGLVVGTNQAFTTGIAGAYRVMVINGNGCTGYDTVQLITTPVPLLITIPLYDSICTGETTNIPLTSNPTGATFNWTATLTSGLVTGFTPDSGLVINQTLLNTGTTSGIVTYHITPKIGNCTGNTIDFPVTVVVGDSVKVSITASGNSVCAGTSVTYNALPVNPGLTPVYHWKVNGINSGTNSSTFIYAPLNTDVVTCELTSSLTVCISNNPATSNGITMTVNPNLPVSITVTANLNPVCAGTSVTFTAHPINEGTLPSYQWKVNGNLVGANLPTYIYIPLNGDGVTCTVNSNATCAVNNPATSPIVTMTVNPNLLVTVSIISSSNPFCAGSSVTFTATPNNGGTPPSYQWKVNGIGVGPNNQVYSYFPNNGDVVTCVLNSNISCPIGNPATSNAITMIVNANLPAGVSITATPNPFCPGSSVTFNATPTNGGSTPSYQWKVNGTNVGTNTNTYSYNPVNNDSVRCVMTSNLACVTSNPASSAKIIMSGTLAPIVTFTSCFDTITSVNAKPFKLKGGIPLGGTYSGPGVNSPTGVFTPSTAGTGTKIITYLYTNVSLCSASKSRNIIVQSAPVFVCGNNLTDIRDNKIYPSVQIGSQCWMSKNLDYGMTVLSSLVQNDNCISEKYCYNDLAGNCTTFGGLYQWDEMMKFDDTQAGQGFCPPGWHVPTENEWQTLFNFYNGNGFAGRPLQDLGFSGFNALRSGVFYLNSSMSFNGFATLFWSSTSWGQFKALSHGMNTYNYSVSLYPSSRANAFPVRCLRD
jgi:uncharacterized protein (TIGR02145 family)